MTRRCPLPRRLIVIAPHPDDEAIAAWALIRKVSRQGGRVDIVVVSDGGASHPQSVKWPRARLVHERRRETRRVMRHLGVGASALHFLALQDGSLDDQPARLRRQLSRIILGSRAPALILSPAHDDDHPDHRAVAAAVMALPRLGKQCGAYRVWPQTPARPRTIMAFPLSPAEIFMKRAAMRRYRTQAGMITDAVAGFAITNSHLRAFCSPVESFGQLR